MSTGTIIGIAAVVILAMIILAGGIFLVVNRGGDDDTATSTTTTTAPSSTSEGGSSSTEGDDPPPSTEEDDPPPSTEGDSGEATIDGQTGTVTGRLDGVEPAIHEIEVPDGVSVIVTVTPLDDIDIVVDVARESVDEGLSGDPEVLSGDGPISETMEITSFFEEPGRYEITIEED